MTANSAIIKLVNHLTLLLAFYDNPHDEEIQEALLLRVLNPTSLPTDNNVISSMVEYYKDNLNTSGKKSDLDDFTKYEFSFSGLECRILGAFYKDDEIFEFGKDDFDVVVTGPRRSLFDRQSETGDRISLRPYFAVPFGDMMIAGCFGLLAAAAEVMPGLAEPILGSLRGGRGRGVAPWDGI